MQTILKLIERNAPMQDIIKHTIAGHAAERERQQRLYDRYTGARLPIDERTMPSYAKIDNRLNNDFVGDIVDTKVGYFAGKPIGYVLDVEEYRDADGNLDRARYERDYLPIQDFNIRNTIEDLDSESAKWAAVCGVCFRYYYIDLNGDARAMNVPPWEVVFIYDQSIDEPQYVMRYYDMEEITGMITTTYTRVEWYDGENITFYTLRGGVYELDRTEPVNPKPHLFSGVPWAAFLNNDEKLSDAEKVLSLIDGYDRTLSDVNSEIEQFRLSYMAFYGSEPDPATIDSARQTGAFGMPGDSKIEFVTKNMNDTAVENHLDRLETNIRLFAKTVNFTDENFSVNASGIAMKYKMFGLESKCITTENKFRKALRRQYQLLVDIWRAQFAGNLDYLDIYFEFKRNFPLNLEDEAKSTAALKGLVSDRTRLGLLSFVNDVDWEMQQMDAEQGVSLELGDDDDTEDI